MSRRRSIEIPGMGHAGQPIPMASVVGNVLISGGIHGQDPETGTFPEDFEGQCKVLFENVNRIMQSAGGSMNDIVRFTFFVRDRSNRDIINNEWVKYFPDEHSRPARHTQLSDLPNQLLVQCEIYAVLE